MKKNGNKNVGRPLKFRTKKELELKINRYFKSCWTQKLDMYGNPIFEKNAKGKKTKNKVLTQFKPYTITGLAVFLETTRDTLLDYEDRIRFSDTIKRAKEICQGYAEEALFVGKNPSGAMFNLKNNYRRWADKKEVDVTSKGKRIEGFNYLKPTRAKK